MNNAERIANLKPEQYQELLVVKKETFDKTLEMDVSPERVYETAA